MTQKTTKGIKISVKTYYGGIVYRKYKRHHTFAYTITIENLSLKTIQLTDRCWKIYDTQHIPKIVKGKGVVGNSPILNPDDTYTYSSGCELESNIGAMKGYYVMKNLESEEHFKVYIPTFQLTIPALSN